MRARAPCGRWRWPVDSQLILWYCHILPIMISMDWFKGKFTRKPIFNGKIRVTIIFYQLKFSKSWHVSDSLASQKSKGWSGIPLSHWNIANIAYLDVGLTIQFWASSPKSNKPGQLRKREACATSPHKMLVTHWYVEKWWEGISMLIWNRHNQNIWVGP